MPKHDSQEGSYMNTKMGGSTRTNAGAGKNIGRLAVDNELARIKYCV